MKFILYSYGSRPEVEITSKEYETFKNAKELYSRIIRVEENFDAVMENYVELEETLLHFGIRHLAFSSMNQNQFHLMRNVMNRRILHVLSTARLYRDGLLRHGKALLNANDTFGRLKHELADSPDQPMAFRMIEALRNYSQHQEFPISSMSAESKWESDNKPITKERAAYFITPKIDAFEISKERKLAPDVRNALKELGTNAEIIGDLRIYVEHLGSIHTLFRKLIADNEVGWKKTMRSGMARYQQAIVGNETPYVVIAHKQGSDNPDDQVQLFDEFFGYRKLLKTKNGTQANLSKRYVKWSGLPTK